GNATALTNIGPTINGVKYPVTSQNYVVNYGNNVTAQPATYTDATYPGSPITYGGAPFSDIDGPGAGNNGKSVFGFSSINDGTSSTLLVSELVVGTGSGGPPYGASYDL